MEAVRPLSGRMQRGQRNKARALHRPLDKLDAEDHVQRKRTSEREMVGSVVRKERPTVDNAGFDTPIAVERPDCSRVWTSPKGTGRPVVRLER